LKGDLEKERTIKDKAINILRTLKEQNKLADIDAFLKDY